MIDNFDKILPLLVFSSEDDFYHAQILKRKKEHPELGSNSYVVKTYFIKSPEDLLFNKEEMLVLANYHNARVCINLNKRSFEKIAFQTLRKISEQIMNKDYKSVRKAYTSVCGAFSNETEKRWIIDVDSKNFSYVCLIGELITQIQPIGDKVYAVLPTKNGWHLITSPFNVQEFKSAFPDIDVQKDNPTILAIP